ncbi:Cytochrome c biogenesis protein CcmG [Rickettsiales bacterium Ac37b]|nr:Cytochrome c biogenesis protein CcmG [Rickettsiales bacterium Ac37b]
MRILYHLPLYFFAATSILIAIKFFNTSSYQSPLIGTKIKDFSLVSNLHPERSFTSGQLKHQLCIINFFASWCNYCRSEHGFLFSLNSHSKIPIYGIAVRDNPVNLKKFLDNYGNPYQDIGNDSLGHIAIEFGIKGFPETILINKEGIIIYHTRGALTRQLYEKEMAPLIEKELKKDI